MNAREGGRQQWYAAQAPRERTTTLRARWAGWALDNRVPLDELEARKEEFKLGWADAIQEAFEADKAEIREEARAAARRRAKDGLNPLEAFDDWWLARSRHSRLVEAAQTAFLIEWRETLGVEDEPVTWEERCNAASEAGADAARQARPEDIARVWFGKWFAGSGNAQGTRVRLWNEFREGWNAARARMDWLDTL